MNQTQIEKFETFMTEYPIFEYRVLDTARVAVRDRARAVCRNECPRYGSTWACPPAVGTLEECAAKIHAYDEALLFTTVAEVSDVLNMDETLATRAAHEEITEKVGEFWRKEGYEIFILSTESCDICEHCTYPEGKPCRFPERMHPCLESFGVVVSELAEEEQMEYLLGGNAILWFSMILLRPAACG